MLLRYVRECASALTSFWYESCVRVVIKQTKYGAIIGQTFWRNFGASEHFLLHATLAQQRATFNAAATTASATVATFAAATAAATATVTPIRGTAAANLELCQDLKKLALSS